MQTPIPFLQSRTLATRSDFVRRVCDWPAAGLALTTLVALFTASSPAALQLVFGNRLVVYALIFGEPGLVVALGAAISASAPQPPPSAASSSRRPERLRHLEDRGAGSGRLRRR